MNQATRWAYLREWYLDTEDDTLRSLLIPGLKYNKPSYVSDTNIGDSGYVCFSDGSEIQWDWDNGDFAIDDWQLVYPYYNDDPLFWE